MKSITPLFLNRIGYSDVHPYEVIETRTDKKLMIRAMNAERDPTWKPEMVPGGFSAICVNQNTQRWIITSDDTAEIIPARLGKKGWKSDHGMHSPSETARNFYDYNF